MGDSEAPGSGRELGRIEPIGVGREPRGVGDEGDEEDEGGRYSISLTL
jgi:hypothetical protein